MTCKDCKYYDRPEDMRIHEGYCNRIYRKYYVGDYVCKERKHMFPTDIACGFFRKKEEQK